MRALLLAAGLGTRLRPVTNTIPKCLVPIKGVPLLEIWLKRLREAGIKELLVNTHYLADQVEDFIANSQYKDFVKIVNETCLLGTAGTLMANLEFFQGEDGMLIHADNYCMADLVAFQKAHMNRPKECLLTMMTFNTDTPSSCGIVQTDQRGVVISFHEKVPNPPGNLANGAIYILSVKLFKILGEEFGEKSSFSEEVLPELMGRIYTYKTNEVFIDIGSPSAYIEVNKIN